MPNIVHNIWMYSITIETVYLTFFSKYTERNQHSIEQENNTIATYNNISSIFVFFF